MTRLGFAGLGWLGESLLKELPKTPGLQAVAVQDVVPERAREIAQRYDVAQCFATFEELARASDVDAVVICTPNALHASQAQMALAAGKDVLVQKPLAVSEHDAMATVAAAGNHVLFVDYTYRFLETMHALRDAVGQEVRSIRAGFHNIYGPGAEKTWFFDPTQSGGGALTDLGVHLIDLGLWLCRPASVQLLKAELSGIDRVEYAAELRLALDDAPFDVTVSWNAPLTDTQIFFEVDTGREVVRWENVKGSFFHFRTLRDGEVRLDRETTLREDTLRAFATGAVPEIDTRVYAVLDAAYGRSSG